MASGVQLIADLGVELDFEITVLLVGDEESVRASFCGSASDDTVFSLVGGVSTLDGPASEVFSVEGLSPSLGI